MSGLGNVLNNVGKVQNTAGQIQNAGQKIAKDASTPATPDKYPVPPSAAHLEDAGFMDRSLSNSVSSFSPSDGGLKLKVGASATNVPFVDLIDGVQDAGKNSSGNPLNNKLIKDYAPNVGTSAEIRVDRERWSIGVKVDGAASLQTQDVEKTAKDFAGIYDQAKGLESKLSGLEKQVNDISNRLQNSQSFKQAEDIINKISKNPALANQQTLNQLKSLLNNGELPKLFNDLQSSLDKVNSAMSDANIALGMIGDKTRSITADAALRGAAEITGAYRTARHDLGGGWGIRGGVEASVIVPLPNPVKTPSDNGLPQFKSLMAKASMHAEVTTNGIENIRQRIGALQNNLSSFQGAMDKTGKAVDQAGKIANKIDPKNPVSAFGQYGAIKDTMDKLDKSSKQASDSIQGLNTNMQGLSSDLDKVSVKTSVGLTTVTPTAPVGFGIRDIGTTIDGPLGKNTKLSLSTGIMNPIGYLQGEKSNYDVIKDKDNNYKLNLVNTEKGNVFHDFYDPTLYAGIGLKFNDEKWYKTQIDTRIEKSMTSDTIRASGIVRQSVGPVSLRGGVLDTDLKQGDKNLTFMAGVGVGSIKHPDILTVDAAVDSVDPNKANNASVRAQINIPF